MSRSPRRICLYEQQPERLEPLVATKPVWELRAGARTLRERIATLFPSASTTFAGRAGIAAIARSRSGQPLAESVPLEGTLFLDAALAPAPGELAPVMEGPAATTRIERDGRLVGAWLEGDGEIPGGETLADRLDEATRGARAVETAAPLLATLPDFIREMSALVTGDAAYLESARVLAPGTRDGVCVLGSHPVRVGEGVLLDPGTTLDAREGPISIAADASCSFNTWLVGPASIGAGTRLLGGTLGPVLGVGPVCRVRGDVAESFLQGYTNKAHDGFIGHSVLGEWVNLGAMTSCSDLKNNYSSVRIDRGSGEESTGLTKLGVFLGDHAKTAIGTLLTTGCVVGVGANVFGFPSLTPKYVPDFAWGTGARGSTSLDRFLETARRAMSRRGVSLDDATRERFAELHRAG